MPVCGSCGARNPGDARFCSACGTALGGTTGTAPSRSERRVVTMLFCDVRGSTSMAERLDPEEWTEVMNEAFELLIEPVARHEGTVAAGLEIVASIGPFANGYA